MTYDSEEAQRFARLVGKLEPGGKLLRFWPLQGGVSAQVTAVELERADGRTQKLVVRRYGASDLMHNPHVAAVEFKLLQIVDSGGLPVSAPCYYDESGALFPTPFIVVEYLEGSPEFAPADLHDLVDQLATTLARIHATPYSLPDLPFLPDAEQRVMRSLSDPPAVLDAAFDEGRIRATLVAVWPPARRNRPVVLHGDFWPGNLLWRDGRLVGVIDWEDAQTGDPLADLANSRLEMLWAYGPEAMQRFTEQYIILAQIDSSNLPYWDLAMALRPLAKFAGWAPDANAEQQMRERLQAFIKQAFERLA